MCHELLCCFGQSEPEKSSSGGKEVVSSPSKPSAAINGGVQAPSPPNRATTNQDEIQAQDEINNENNKEKPMSSPIQGGEKQPKDKQDQQNRQEQDEDKLSKIAKALSFKPKGSKEEKSLRVPPENHKSSEEQQKVLAQDVFPKEKKYSPKEQDLGTKKPATSNQEQQVPSPPKEQIRPPQEKTDQKTKIAVAEGNKEFDPSGDDS
ncbi:hypothetical protein IHE45_05G129100 [Dioscorea alata]|uniref:Uncharacterized protein n=1 Tax=Dioscorea alata TaxID=55571 RepID=A0ACB7W523_DIOAL|nr:hypothetical protein IHE45_05G129100 [Dioscorea alata]